MDSNADTQRITTSFDDNLVARDLKRQIVDIERVLDGTDNNSNRMPLTPAMRDNLKLQLQILHDRVDALRDALGRDDVVHGDHYGRTRDEINAETSRLR